MTLDHVYGAAKHLDDPDDEPGTEKARIRTLCSTCYDTLPGYRMMEGLRNVAVHAALPLDGIVYARGRVGQTGESLVKRTVVRPRVTTRHLRKAKLKGLAQQVVDAAADDDECVDVMPWVDEYVEGIISVTSDVLRTHTEAAETATARLQAVVEQWAKAIGQEKIPAAVAAVEDEVIPVEGQDEQQAAEAGTKRLKSYFLHPAVIRRFNERSSKPFRPTRFEAVTRVREGD